MSEFEKTDFIEKSNFNPKMFNACNDTAYDCGYQQGRTDALTEIIQHIKACENEAYDNVEPIIGSVLMAIRIKAEQLRGDANE